MARPLLLLPLLGALLLPRVALAQKKGDDEPQLIDTQREELVSENPPCKIVRPRDSWQFIDLDAMRVKMQQEGQDPRGLQGLVARLWFGSAQANIFVRAYPYPSTQPPELEALGQQQLENLQRGLRDAQVKGQGQGRIGKRPAFVFELEGTSPQSPEGLVILEAVAYRAEDNQVFVISLEVPQNCSQLKEVKKDFKKLLKKARV